MHISDFLTFGIIILVLGVPAYIVRRVIIAPKSGSTRLCYVSNTKPVSMRERVMGVSNYPLKTRSIDWNYEEWDTRCEILSGNLIYRCVTAEYQYLNNTPVEGHCFGSGGIAQALRVTAETDDKQWELLFDGYFRQPRMAFVSQNGCSFEEFYFVEKNGITYLQLAGRYKEDGRLCEEYDTLLSEWCLPEPVVLAKHNSVVTVV